jgi:hypothetical protein
VLFQDQRAEVTMAIAGPHATTGAVGSLKIAVAMISWHFRQLSPYYRHITHIGILTPMLY